MKSDADDDRDREQNGGSPDRQEGDDQRMREPAEDMEPSDGPWTHQQGLYGSTEYGGWLGGQARQGGIPGEDEKGSKSRVQGPAGKGPDGLPHSDERIAEEEGKDASAGKGQDRGVPRTSGREPRSGDRGKKGESASS